jgi:hypothetical protein
MNRTDVLLLQSIRSNPCLTITLPTHRTAPDNQQDPIRLRNLLTQATNRLLADYSRRELEPLLARLDHLAQEIDFRYTLDGLALFASIDFGRSFATPFPLPERVVVDETFATRDLVYALNRAIRYWVLVLSEQPTRLYEGTREILVEVNNKDFPLTHEGPGGATRLPGGPGVSRSAHRDEYARQFYRSVDGALGRILAQDPQPVILVGVDRNLAFFQEVTAHGSHIAGAVAGSHDKTSAHELGKLVWPLVQAHKAQTRNQALERLGTAVGGQRSASTLGEVWRMAHEGRGDQLLVEEDYHTPARVDESGLHLTLVDDPTPPDVIDDAVDDVIETVLAKGGEVVFVDNGALTKHGRIALILRY